MQNKVSVIICAAGKGERAGFDKNKLLAPLWGEPALMHTLRKFNIEEIDEVIVASSENDFEVISLLCSHFKNYFTVLGGTTRYESVKRALEKVTNDIVLIHDGARPYVTKKIILDCIESVKKFGSGIAGVKCTDTAVYADEQDISERLDRNKLYLLQTPQGFLTNDIKKAYSLSCDNRYTDDSAVYGKFIKKPHVFEGDYANKKLTYREDFLNEAPQIHLSGGELTGFGVDVHAFGEGNEVTLCGKKIPCDKKLIAHSDGDVAIHAVMDAMLSACGLRDIGYYFPDNDDKFKGADSLKMLEKVLYLLKEKNLKAHRISLSIQAEKPKLKNYIQDMKNNLNKVTDVNIDDIAISAGTCEGLGFVGEGLGICAYSVVTLVKT